MAYDSWEKGKTYKGRTMDRVLPDEESSLSQQLYINPKSSAIYLTPRSGCLDDYSWALASTDTTQVVHWHVQVMILGGRPGDFHLISLAPLTALAT